MMRRSANLLAATTALAAHMMADAAMAQAAAANDGAAATGDSGEIIMTATRKSESINKVPLSVSALSREAFDSRGIRTFTDVIRQTPGVAFEKSNTTTNIAIRGVNSSVGAATTGI